MKKILALLLALLLLAGGFAGWHFYGSQILALFNPVRNDWKVEEETGLTYYMDENSDPVTGWFDQEGSRYYLDPDQGGAKCTGWMEIDGKTYYFQDSGAMVSGWIELEGKNRYFLDSGALATGWQTLAGTEVYFCDDGTPYAGWLEEAGVRYYLTADGTPHQGWLELEEGTYYLDGRGTPRTGWTEVDGKRHYLDEKGLLGSGWITDSGSRYYLDGQGTPVTGWLEVEGSRYYLKEDGTPAVGALMIDGQKYFFSASGVNLLLVNRWNPVPEGYAPELVTLPNGREVAAPCYDALMDMLEACEAAGCTPDIIGANRTTGSQRYLFNKKVAEYEAQGYTHGAAYSRASEWVALPGTSEHELGLALDIVDKWNPSQITGEYNALEWLSKHCWDYGFILRYPAEKKDITGIGYESWHFRYVGLEIAQELKASGLCLEEYLDQLTGDGSTCGNPDALEP